MTEESLMHAMKPVSRAIWQSSIVSMLGHTLITGTVMSGYFAVLNMRLCNIDSRINTFPKVGISLPNNTETKIEIAQPPEKPEEHSDASRSN